MRARRQVLDAASALSGTSEGAALSSSHFISPKANSFIGRNPDDEIVNPNLRTPWTQQRLKRRLKQDEDRDRVRCELQY